MTLVRFSGLVLFLNFILGGLAAYLGFCGFGQWRLGVIA